MSKKRIILFGLAALTMVAAVLFIANGTTYAQGGGQGRGRGSHDGGQQGHGQQQGGIDDFAQLYEPGSVGGELPDDVIEALNATLLDEYHAYAVYDVVIEQFGEVRPFVNIQNAEVQHSTALETVLTHYGLDIPSPQPLEEELIFDSLADACELGAAAEIANFELYDEWINTVSDYPDIVQVFTALRDASEFNHLPAFESCAGNIPFSLSPLA